MQSKLLMDEKIRKGFEILANRLSPENISCDGELNQTQIREKVRGIKRQWKELEKQAGRKVSLEEVELWQMADARNRAIRGQGVGVVR